MNITAKPEGNNLQLQYVRQMNTIISVHCASSSTSLKKDSD
jgi:hypothetical protein